MELITILLYAFGFLAIYAYVNKWFLKNLHDKPIIEKKYAQKKWHFWGAVLMFYSVGGFIGAGGLMHFAIGLQLIPLAFIIWLLGGFYYSIFLNKIRGLTAGHRGSGWWDTYAMSPWGVKIATGVVFASAVLYFMINPII